MKRFGLSLIIVWSLNLAACTGTPDVMAVVNQLSTTAAQLNQQGVLTDAQTAPIMMGVAHCHDLGKAVVASYDAYQAADTASKAALASQLDQQLNDLSAAFLAIPVGGLPAQAAKILTLVQQGVADVTTIRSLIALGK